MSIDRNTFPLNGRVAILDDDYDEIQSLTYLFGKYGVPYIYYNGKINESYKTGKALGIRLLIADIALVKGVVKSELVMSTLHGSISNIIKEDNGPYVIAFWSTKDKIYEKDIPKMLDALPQKPHAHFYLDKSKFSKITDDKLENAFEKEVLDKLSEIPFLSYISQWENGVNESLLSTVTSIDLSVDKSTKPERYANEFASILAKMAIGNQICDLSEEIPLSNEQKITASLDALNIVLQQHNKLLPAKISKEFNKKIAIAAPNVKKSSHINALMWTGVPYNFCSPQNVYISEKADTRCKLFLKKELHGQIDKGIFIDIDITHKCDYVLKKHNTVHQFVKGLLFEGAIGTSLGLRDSCWEVGDLLIGEKEYKFVVFLYETFNRLESEIKEKLLFSISDDVHNEIRSKLGAFYQRTAKIKM